MAKAKHDPFNGLGDFEPRLHIDAVRMVDHVNLALALLARPKSKLRVNDLKALLGAVQDQLEAARGKVA